MCYNDPINQEEKINMSTELTPMKRYKTGLDILKSHLTEFYQVTLNHAESKYIPYAFQKGDKSETKGVESDFILIFKDNEKTISFAFAFDYIARTPEQQTVLATIKTGKDNDSIRSGAPMDMETFRETLNSFNKNLASLKERSVSNVINSFSTLFLKEEFNITAQIKQADKAVTEFLSKKNEVYKIDNVEQDYITAKDNRVKAESKAAKRIKLSAPYKLKQKLLDELERVEAVLAQKTALINKEENIAELKQKEEAANKSLIKSKDSLKSDIDEELKKYPASVSKRLKVNR